MFRPKWLPPIAVMLVAGTILFCGCPPSPSTIEAVTPTVLRASERGTLTPVPLGTSQGISNGDRVSTSAQGEGWLKLPCAWLRVFRDTDLQFKQISVDGANLAAAKGAMVTNTTRCASFKMSSGGDPPEAVVEMRGTTVFFAFDSNKHITLLAVQDGTATLTNVLANGSSGDAVTVAAGNASVVRRRNPPEPARPISGMEIILGEMDLDRVYARAVQVLQSERIRAFDLPTLIRQTVIIRETVILRETVVVTVTVPRPATVPATRAP